jgi:hypothetical protein
MFVQELIRELLCGCRYFRPTGVFTHYCERHEAARQRTLEVEVVARLGSDR